MKKVLILSAVISLFLSSCGVSKLAREQKNLLNGTWTLDNVRFENQPGTFKSVLFNDAQDICFEGSTWFFRKNNNTGSYAIAPSSLCQSGDRFIRWSVVESDLGTNQLQFKMIDEKYKDISGGLGYRLTIKNITNSNMELASEVTANGAPVLVVYEFSKK